MPPMSLEHVEEYCVKFLEQTESPIVPVVTLLRYLQQQVEFNQLTERDLVDFLRDHELFTLLELGDEEQDAEREAAGIPTGPRVILKTRIPTKAEFGVLIDKQLEKMADALEKALDAAEDEGREDAAVKLRETLDRAEKLRTEFRKLF